MSKAFKKKCSKSLSDLTSISLTTFDKRHSRLWGSVDKLDKKGRLPQRYLGCKRKGSPIKEGFLCVQCLPDVKWKWKLRYVMLFQDKLCYMKPKAVLGEGTGSMDFNAINISNIISVKISSESQIFQISDSETFYVKTTTHGRSLFRCRDEEERDKWVTALLTAKSAEIMKDRENKSCGSQPKKVEEINFTSKCLPLAPTFWFL